MGKLIYTGNMSLDGYTVDAEGTFDFAEPSEEVHAFINDLERSTPTYLYGRLMYETMVWWETMDEPEAVMRDYATLWKAATKIVVSSSLTEVASERTTIVRELDPLYVSQLKQQGDVGVGGAVLAGELIRAGLVDEYHLFVSPVIVGAGKAPLPQGVRVNLTLLDERRFDNGTVFLRYGA